VIKDKRVDDEVVCSDGSFAEVDTVGVEGLKEVSTRSLGRPLPRASKDRIVAPKRRVSKQEDRTTRLEISGPSLPAGKEAITQQLSTAQGKEERNNPPFEAVVDNLDAGTFKTDAPSAIWPLNVARDIQKITSRLLKRSRTILVQDIAEDVRGTLTRDYNYVATPGGLEKAKGWTDLVNCFGEAGTLLAAFAVRFGREEDRVSLIQNELDSCRREILHNDTASIASHMEVVLSARWGIGANITRTILESKLDDAIDSTMLQASLELAPPRFVEGEQKDWLPAGGGADEEQLRLGAIAAHYDAEVRTMARGARGREEGLRKRFPDFRIWRAIDECPWLTQQTKETFFSSLRSHKQDERFRFIGDVLSISGTTLYDYYKEYRKQNGLQKKRSPNRSPIIGPTPNQPNLSPI
jgi:hypothetical protein